MNRPPSTVVGTCFETSLKIIVSSCCVRGLAMEQPPVMEVHVACEDSRKEQQRWLYSVAIVIVIALPSTESQLIIVCNLPLGCQCLAKDLGIFTFMKQLKNVWDQGSVKQIPGIPANGIGTRDFPSERPFFIRFPNKWARATSSAGFPFGMMSGSDGTWLTGSCPWRLQWDAASEWLPSRSLT